NPMRLELLAARSPGGFAITRIARRVPCRSGLARRAGVAKLADARDSKVEEPFRGHFRPLKSQVKTGCRILVTPLRRARASISVPIASRRPLGVRGVPRWSRDRSGPATPSQAGEENASRPDVPPTVEPEGPLPAPTVPEAAFP